MDEKVHLVRSYRIDLLILNKGNKKWMTKIPLMENFQCFSKYEDHIWLGSFLLNGYSNYVPKTHIMNFVVNIYRSIYEKRSESNTEFNISYKIHAKLTESLKFKDSLSRFWCEITDDLCT